MDLNFQCRCGKVQGVVQGADDHGTRMICYCDDCQAYAHWLEQADDLLDAQGGTDITPFRPKQIKILEGEDHIFCCRLSPKGMFRFYTACCKSPIANQMNTTLPFAGFATLSLYRSYPKDVNKVDTQIGSNKMRIMGKWGIGPMPKDAHPKVSLGFVMQVLGYITKGFLSGASKPSPFFDGKQLTTDTRILSGTEREHLRKYCGPHPNADSGGMRAELRS